MYSQYRKDIYLSLQFSHTGFPSAWKGHWNLESRCLTVCRRVMWFPSLALVQEFKCCLQKQIVFTRGSNISACLNYLKALLKTFF